MENMYLTPGSVSGLVFVMYDWWVARRQHVVMNRAVASTAIVRDLFPSQVRNQLYEVSAKDEKWNDGPRMSKKVEALVSGGDIESAGSKPIAQEFKETTVLFADIVGKNVQLWMACLRDDRAQNCPRTRSQRLNRFYCLECRSYSSRSLSAPRGNLWPL